MTDKVVKSKLKKNLFQISPIKLNVIKKIQKNFLFRFTLMSVGWFGHGCLRVNVYCAYAATDKALDMIKRE